jgi:pimeloyl-ACP methyl ester carboxylesterase
VSMPNLAIAALITAAALAALMFAGVWAFQAYGIYQFPRSSPPAADGVRAVQFRSSDGQMIGARLALPQPGKPVIMSFYGNGAGVDASFERLSALRDRGFGIAMMEYRGSGATGGKSSEMNFARDALAFYDQLDDLMGLPATARVLHGFSLGAGVGSRLAAARPFEAVVFEAAPYRACLYYQDAYKGFPFCQVMWAERYDNVDHIRAISAPKLIVHGALDQALPVARARQLFAEVPGPKEYLEIEDGHHADLTQLGLTEAMDAFISRSVAPSSP